MVAERIQFGGTKLLPARHMETVGQHFHRHSHALKVFSDRVNSVGFFHAQFGSITNHETLFASGAKYGEHDG